MSTTTGATASIPPDQRLRVDPHWFREPPRDVLPAFDQPLVFSPLCLLLCLAPLLGTFTESSLDASLAKSGLAAWNCLLADDVVDATAADQPPLGVWATAAFLGLRFIDPLTSVRMASQLGAVGSLVFLWLTAARLGGSRSAVLTLAFAAGFPWMWMLATMPAGFSLGLMCWMASVFSVVRHRTDSGCGLSAALLASGIFAGLTLLAWGPSALLPLAALHAAILVWWRPEQVGPSCRIARSRLGPWIGWSTVLALAVVMGFWPVLALEGWAALARKLTEPSLPIDVSGGDLAWGGNRIWTWLGPATWAAVGMSAMTVAWTTLLRSGLPVRSGDALALAWLGIAIAGRWLFGRDGGWTVWHLAASAPLAMLAGRAVDDLFRRRHPMASCWAGAVIAAASFLATLEGWRRASTSVQAWAALVAVAAAVWFLMHRPWNLAANSQHRMAALRMTGAGLLAMHWTWCHLAALHPANELRSLEAAVDRARATAQPPDHILVVATGEPLPASLAFRLRSAWPAAEWSVERNWTAALAGATSLDSRKQPSRVLVVSWSRRDLRILAQAGSGWQTTIITDNLGGSSHRLGISLLNRAASP